MKRPHNFSFLRLFSLFGLMASFLLGMPFAALAAFVPADNQIIETLKGKWKFEAPMSGMPVLTFSANDAEISFSPIDVPMEWENINKVIYMPKVQTNIVLSRTYLDCPGSPLKLWFESGESLELGKNSCSEARLYATLKTGDRVEDRFRENHLAQILSVHLPVAVSQGQKALILEAKDEDAVRKYQVETSVEPNSAFSKMMRKKWADALKRGY